MAAKREAGGPADLAGVTGRLEAMLGELIARAAVDSGEAPPPDLLEWLRVVESLTLSAERLARALRAAQQSRAAQPGGAAGSEEALWQINELALARPVPQSRASNKAGQNG